MPTVNTNSVKRKELKSWNESPKEYNTQRWRRLSKQVRREQPICANCKVNPSEHTDHINPVRLGGDFYERSNLQGLCASCHNSKSGKEGSKHKKKQL